MRTEAENLLTTVREMLGPVSATPTPQRLKLDAAMSDLERAINQYDQDKMEELRRG